LCLFPQCIIFKSGNIYDKRTCKNRAIEIERKRWRVRGKERERERERENERERE
jgi:hypothetical protein